MLGGKPVTPEYVFSNVSDQKICPYCKNPYLITKKYKKTCGNLECVNKCKNEWKRDRYKEAKTRSKS
jgi:hypothetical protein